jgi:hypothetical protein
MDGELINPNLQRPSKKSKISVPPQVQQESQTSPITTGRSSSATPSASSSMVPKYDPRTDY